MNCVVNAVRITLLVFYIFGGPRMHAKILDKLRRLGTCMAM
jgi:hypothetical protein